MPEISRDAGEGNPGDDGAGNNGARSLIGITYTKSLGLALALATATWQNEIISARVRVRRDAMLTPRLRGN